MITVFHARLYSRFIEIQNSLTRKMLHRMNQGYNFLFSNRENVRALIQFRGEIIPQHLKILFHPRNRHIPFQINSTSVLDRSNETSQVFPVLKSTSCFLPQSTLSCRSDSSSKTNSSCCHK